MEHEESKIKWLTIGKWSEHEPNGGKVEKNRGKTRLDKPPKYKEKTLEDSQVSNAGHPLHIEICDMEHSLNMDVHDVKHYLNMEVEEEVVDYLPQRNLKGLDMAKTKEPEVH
ncbi:hypothetical protein HAX54_004338 [Datura stramonium]|uniref:Uncharacterized protein n=1 Tax=Datura stramonium TaxID=4076 RepID=A0ABS8RVC9_DATST|nr:hypothetical protein [Datura stramonium]